MLTIKLLKELEGNSIIAQGVTDEPKLEPFTVQWRAIRGHGYHDWAIYYAPAGQPWTDGIKIANMDIVKSLVPCSAEACLLYRY